MWNAVVVLWAWGAGMGGGLVGAGPADAGRVPAAVSSPGATTGGARDSASSLPDLAGVRFRGLLQAWYLDGDAVSPRSFRLRRSMLKLSGDLSESATWTLSVDPAKSLKLRNSYGMVGESRTVSETRPNQASLMLQDAYLRFRRDGLRVDVGQFRLPVGLEGSLLSSSKLETVERALLSSAGKLTQVRDVGAAARIDLPLELDLAIGVFNGLGEEQNGTDRDDAKALAGRVGFRTPLTGLSVGVSGAWGGERGEAEARRRAGADAAFARGPLNVRGEVFRATDAGIRRLGYYGLAAYRVGRWEGVVRYDVWDPDRGGSGDGTELRDALIGGSYFFAGSPVALRLNYIRRDADPGGGATDLLLMELQASW